jgi:predicted ATP-dependent endonuclease of OLD family
MFIKKIKIRKLYGYLDKNISLNKNINILVGINGSGKTSLLNTISWLLRPDLQILCTTVFELLYLEFYYKKHRYEIECKQTPGQLMIYLRNLSNPNDKYNPLLVRLFRHTIEITETELEELKESYSGLSPTKKEIKTWKFLNNLPTPIIIGLDRNLYRNIDDEHPIDYDRVKQGGKVRINPTLLNNVKNLTNKNYTYYRNTIIKLNDDLRDKMMFATFDEDIQKLIKISNKAKISFTLEEIDTLESRMDGIFNSYIQRTNASSSTIKKIKKYFSDLRNEIVFQNAKSRKSRNLILLNQYYGKIRSLVANFEDFENKAVKAFKPLKEYLDILDKFFIDTSKKLYFKESDNQLYYQVLDQKGKILGQDKNVNYLSSGEKQILMLLTYIKFNSGKIFLIDEPELSLHPRWQDEFINSVKNLMGKNTQLIIATHSPSIVGKHIEYCRTLTPYQ